MIELTGHKGTKYIIKKLASSEKSVGHTLQWAPEARLAQSANPMWDNAASVFSCSQPGAFSSQFALSGKRYAVLRESYSKSGSRRYVTEMLRCNAWGRTKEQRRDLFDDDASFPASLSCARGFVTGPGTPKPASRTNRTVCCRTNVVRLD